MKIGKYLTPSGFWTAAFVACVFILFIIGTISIRQINALSESQDLVTKSHKIRIDLEHMFSELKDAETAQRGYIITKDPQYLEPSNYSHVRINKSLIGLKELTKDNPKRQQQIDKLTTLVNRRFQMLRDNLIAVNRISTNSDSFKEMMMQEKEVMEEIRSLVNNMIQREAYILEQQEKTHGDEIFFTPLTSLILVVFSVVVFLFTFLHINRNLKHVKKLNHSLKLMNETFVDAERIGDISHWQLDVDSRQFIFSDNKYKLIGYDVDSFVPTVERFLELVYPADRSKVMRSFERDATTNAHTVYFRIWRSDGKLRYIKSVSKLTHDGDGREIIIGIDADITAQHKNTLKLQRKNQMLKRSNDELTSFNHIVSHDLQEPLRKIQMFVSRIDEKEFLQFSENTQRYISRIQSSANRAQQLISDLLIYSRISRDESKVELTDLNSVLESVKADLSHKITDYNAMVVADHLPTVNIVENQVKQIFHNLLSNSLKYRKEDRAPEVVIKYKIIGGNDLAEFNIIETNLYHSITFSDNGIGFDTTYSTKIFNLFHRLHDNEKYSGTGVGLAICKKIAENHKGYILANSTDEGAIFTLLLPKGGEN